MGIGSLKWGSEINGVIIERVYRGRGKADGKEVLKGGIG